MCRIRIGIGLISVFVLVVGMSLVYVKSDIIVVMQFELFYLDLISVVVGVIDFVFYFNVFEGLICFGLDGFVNLGLVESWIIFDDGKIYIFKLYFGVMFYDGIDMIVEDVKFSLDCVWVEDSQNVQKLLFVGIESVDVVDLVIVKVILFVLNGSFLFNMVWGDVVIVVLEIIVDIKINFIGIGVFKFVNWN